MLETFTIDTFAGHVDETFHLHFDSDVLELRLSTATRLGEPYQPDGRAPFSLVFIGPADRVLPQAIYGVDHASIGAFELFLVALGPGEGGMQYEAVFT